MSEWLDTDADWHGWSLSTAADYALHIGRLDGRKSVCLYERDGSTIRTLAFFKDAEAARKALRAIDSLARI